ncbi:hypothetical protein Bdiaspc4_35645 [Bradyrhizobium diazoefficiens]|nr:hypothetical protein AAV28_31385 [Bradyrhizobium diazoefficiens USDA 110]QBP25501.1 hypothetical protein Bdiaspc4_35645 [Bradyrhizobium diazoefficiens]
MAIRDRAMKHQADRNPPMHSVQRPADVTQRDLDRTSPASDFLRNTAAPAWIAMIATELHWRV